MKTVTREQYRNAFQTADQVLQERMGSDEVMEIIQNTAETNKLSDDQTAALSYVIGTVMLGLAKKESFPEMAQQELGLNQEVVGNIYNQSNVQQLLDSHGTNSALARSSNTDVVHHTLKQKAPPSAGQPFADNKQSVIQTNTPPSAENNNGTQLRGSVLDFLKHEPGVLLDEGLGNTIRAKFTALPKEKQDYILTSGIKQKLQFKETKPLRFGQMNTVENELLLVLLGMEEANMLATNITHKAQVARDRAEIIARVMKNSIIQPFTTVGTTFATAAPYPKEQIPEAPPAPNVASQDALPRFTPPETTTPPAVPANKPSASDALSLHDQPNWHPDHQEKVFTPERKMESELNQGGRVGNTGEENTSPKNDPYREGTG